MLTDIEKAALRIEETRNDKLYKDLVYDLESFIIDLCYGDCDTDASKQAYNGKVSLVNSVINEKETSKVFARLRPILSELGIREEIKGFRLIESLVLEAARCIQAGKTYYMKTLYPAVASIYGISSHNCERLCRYACSFIEIPDDFSAKYPYLDEITHRTYEKVTVKELVDTLANYLVFRCKFKSKYIADKRR